MRTATLTTTSGYTWSTSINGTDQEIQKYFLEKYFNVSHNPEREVMEKVIQLNLDGKLFKTSTYYEMEHSVEKHKHKKY